MRRLQPDELRALYNLVMQSARRGELTLEAIKTAADIPINIGEPDESGITILKLATAWNQIEIVEFLLSEENSQQKNVLQTINSQHIETKTTALFQAAEKGHATCATFLIKAGAKTSIAACDGTTPLLAAAGKNHIECVRALKEMGVSLLAHAGPAKNTPLMAAAENGHSEMIAYLLTIPVVSESIRRTGRNLWYAAEVVCRAIENNHLDCVRVLVEAGANVTLPAGPNNDTPLMTAVRNGYEEIVLYLLELKAVQDSIKNPKNKAYVAAVVCCATEKNGHVGCLRHLANAGVDLTQACRDNFTPLLVAAQQGVISTMHFLLHEYWDSAKIRASLKEQQGIDAVCLAAGNGHLACVTELIKAGAHPAAKRSDGATPLLLALKKGEHEVALYLQSQGVEPDVQCQELIEKHKEEIKFAEEVQAPFYKEDRLKLNEMALAGNVTSLWAAIRGGHYETAMRLLKTEPRIKDPSDDSSPREGSSYKSPSSTPLTSFHEDNAENDEVVAVYPLNPSSLSS